MASCGDFSSVDRSALLADFEQHVGEYDVVVLSDYAKGTLADIRRLIDAARASGKPIIVDPKGIDFERYRGATLITPNLSEFEAVAGRCRDLADLHDKARALSLDVEVADLAEAEDPLVEPGPDVHVAAVHVVGQVVDHGEPRVAARGHGRLDRHLTEQFLQPYGIEYSFFAADGSDAAASLPAPLAAAQCAAPGLPALLPLPVSPPHHGQRRTHSPSAAGTTH